MNKTTVIISVLAIIVSVLAICISAYRSPNLGIDYQGLITAVQSLIVTVLIGWQIYQIIYIERIVKRKIDKKVSEYDKVVDDKLAKSQIERINEIMAMAFERRDLDLLLYYASHIPRHLVLIENLDETYVNEEIDKLNQAFQRLNKPLQQRTFDALINSYRPLAHFPAVYAFLRLCEEARQSGQVLGKD